MHTRNESLNVRGIAALALFAAIAVVLSSLAGSVFLSCVSMSDIRASISGVAGDSVAAWSSMLILCLPQWTIAALGATAIALRYKSSWLPRVLVFSIAFPILALLLPRLIFGEVIRLNLIHCLLDLAATPIAIGAAAGVIRLTQNKKTCVA